MRKLFYNFAIIWLFAVFYGFNYIWTEDFNVQESNPTNWGDKIRLGSTFTNTDSLKLRRYNVDDSLYSGANDTMYSDALDISGENADGIMNVVFYPEQLTAGGDSIFVDIRIGEKFDYYDNSSGFSYKVVWGAWKYLFTSSAGTASKLSLVQSDSTWWVPAKLRQYRVRKTDADGSQERGWLTDYLR